MIDFVYSLVLLAEFVYVFVADGVLLGSHRVLTLSDLVIHVFLSTLRLLKKVSVLNLQLVVLLADAELLLLQDAFGVPQLCRFFLNILKMHLHLLILPGEILHVCLHITFFHGIKLARSGASWISRLVEGIGRI